MPRSLVLIASLDALLACGATQPSPGDAGADRAPSPDARREDALVDAIADVAARDVATLDAPRADTGPRADTTVVPTDVPLPAPTYPLVDPPAGFDGFPPAAPMVLDGASARTVSNVAIRNDNGDCLVIHGGADIIVEHVAIGPCAGDGIRVEGGARRITIRDVYVHDTVEIGVDGDTASSVQVLDSHFARNRSGGYFQDCSAVRFERNTVLDVQGGNSRGQLVQFNRVDGGGSAVRCNVGENRPGESNPEDAINLFDSNGVAGDPILVEGNRVKGGGPSDSGGGILLGDGGGSYQTARDNTVADPGQYGIAAAGGQHMAIVGNRVFARQQSFTNVGVYVWNQYSSACSDVTVSGNRVNWTNSAGDANPYWDAGNCTAVSESGDDWSAALTASAVDTVPAACR